MEREELIGAVYTFLSFLFREPKAAKKIKIVYLFGSVARGEFDERSDIDIFVDCSEKDSAEMEKAVRRALGKFSKEKAWKLRDLKNELRVKVGDLARWTLKESVEREGVLLYSQIPTPALTKFYIVRIEPIKEVARRNKVIRFLFGRAEYEAKGAVQEVGGEKLAPRIFSIPVTSFSKIASKLSAEKVKFKLREVWC